MTVDHMIYGMISKLEGYELDVGCLNFPLDYLSL